MGPDSRCALRDAQHFRQFSKGELAPIAELQHLAISGPQPRNGVQELPYPFLVQQLFLRAGEVGHEVVDVVDRDVQVPRPL